MSQKSWLFDHGALQEYLIICCQDTRGGLIDKPGKSRDFYHTCYTLSGLAVAQNLPNGCQAVLGDHMNLLVSIFFSYDYMLQCSAGARVGPT